MLFANILIVFLARFFCVLKVVRMSGALLQISAYGAQDVEIINSDAASYFHAKFVQHAPFAIQPVEITLPSMDAVFGQTARVTVPRNGDLLGKLWIEARMQKQGPSYLPAEELLREVRLVIGGQVIDTHTSNFVRARNEVFMSSDERRAYARLVDFADGEPDGTVKTFYLPLSLWFCEYARALPLIAIQQHTVELHFTFAKSVAGVNPAYMPKLRLFAEYVFLGDAERAALVSRKHFIPIPQIFVQEDRALLSTSSTITVKTQIFARNPCQYMLWTFAPKNSYATFSTDFQGGTSDALDPLLDASLTLNGYERVSLMPSFFFNAAQPYAYCGTSPATGVHFVSFALKPGESGQPSGSLNMSRVASIVLNQTFKRVDLNALVATDLTSPSDITVAASNFEIVTIYCACLNFLRIEGGLAGTAYPL